MKEDLHHLDIIKIHGPDLDCEFDGSCDSPATTDKEISTGPVTLLSTDCKSSEYRLPYLLPNRLTAGHIPPIPFQYSMTCSQIETMMLSKVNDTTEHTRLDWQMKIRETSATDKQQMDMQSPRWITFHTSTVWTFWCKILKTAWTAHCPSPFDTRAGTGLGWIYHQKIHSVAR